jgi:hypothetical protein
METIMADATVRVSGPILSRDVRQGTSRDGNPYRISTLRVLVEEAGIADVRVPDTLDKFSRGEAVDLLCDVSVYSGRAQLSATRDLLAPA